MSKGWFYCMHCQQWFYMDLTTSIVKICPKCGARMEAENE